MSPVQNPRGGEVVNYSEATSSRLRGARRSSRPHRAVRGCLLALGLFVGLLAGGTAPAQAHGPASTLVRISLAQPATAEEGPVVRLVAKVALQELDVAYGTTLADEAREVGTEETVEEHLDELESLVEDRVTLTSDHADWSVTVDSLAAGTDQGQDAIRVVLFAAAPTTDPTEADLTWHVVTDEVVTHKAYIGAVDADGETTLVATLTRDDPTTTLTIDEPGTQAGSSHPAPRSLWTVGFEHFREGADHLLFLSLIALGVARRRAGLMSTLRRLAVLTLTFTVGHSLSLALATVGWVSPPSQWVEVAIAVTILLAAVHTVRPTLPFRIEVAVTAAFGVIHGFGFAGTLEELSLRGRELAVPLLTFNLGLEVAQLAALVLNIAPLVVIARSAVASRVLAGVVGVVAASWIVQRAFGTSNVLDPVLNVLLASPERLAGLLCVGALLLLLLRRWAPPTQATPAAGVDEEVDDPAKVGSSAASA